MVVEGAEEAGDGTRLQALLSVLAPQTVGLVFTRYTHQVSTLKPLDVEAELEREDALALLREICQGAADAAVIAAAHGLLGGHPLALTWAGHQIAAREEPPQAFLAALKSETILDLHQPGDEHRTLRWLFRRSASHVTLEGQRVLAAAGLLAQQPFALSAAVAALGTQDMDETSARQALKQLVRHGLLRVGSGDEDQWEFTHALAHRFARAGDTDGALLATLGNWAVQEFDRAVAQIKTNGEFSPLSRAINHVSALLSADHNAEVLNRLTLKLRYGGHDRIVELGRLDLARTANEADRAWLESAPMDRRNLTSWQRELSVSYDNLGHVETAAGSLDAARTASAAVDPGDSDWQRDLAASYDRLGHVETATGSLDAARKAYELSLAIRERLATADRSNSEWQRDLSVSCDKLGDVETAAGRLDAARKAYELSLAIRERLAKLNPDNSVWQEDLQWVQNRIADLKIAGHTE